MWAVRRRERLRKAGIPRQVWLAGDGMIYAQQPVITRPAVIKLLLGATALAVLWGGGYVVWALSSLIHGHAGP
jgi:hypothetical protein